MKPVAGDIVFIRGKGLISRIIRWYDKGEFSHVATFVSEDEIIEAEYSTKVRIVKFDYDDYEIVPMNYDLLGQREVRQFSSSLTGRWYDYFYVIALWLSLASKRPVKEGVNDPKKLICSELVAAILIYTERGDDNLLDLTPNELYKELLTLLEDN